MRITFLVLSATNQFWVNMGYYRVTLYAIILYMRGYAVHAREHGRKVNEFYRLTISFLKLEGHELGKIHNLQVLGSKVCIVVSAQCYGEVAGDVPLWFNLIKFGLLKIFLKIFLLFCMCYYMLHIC